MPLSYQIFSPAMILLMLGVVIIGKIIGHGRNHSEQQIQR
jgi:hypothetical protein